MLYGLIAGGAGAALKSSSSRCPSISAEQGKDGSELAAHTAGVQSLLDVHGARDAGQVGFDFSVGQARLTGNAGHAERPLHDEDSDQCCSFGHPSSPAAPGGT